MFVGSLNQKKKNKTGMKSITSAGGPLVCMEAKLVDSWLGISGSSTRQNSSEGLLSDYERACRVEDYLGTVSLGDSVALVLGDMPLETFIWEPLGKLPRIVRVYYGDPGSDLAQILEAVGEFDLDEPAEMLPIDLTSSPMVIFDSAYPGSAKNVDRLIFSIPVGRYLALTKQLVPDERTSVLVHIFQPSQ